MIQEILDWLRKSTELNVQDRWLFCDNFAQDKTNWFPALPNEKGHLVWPAGHQVRYFTQTLTVPSNLDLFPLKGLSLRLKLTWWAQSAQIYLDNKLVQEGDLFDPTARILLSNSVNPGDSFKILVKLTSPIHDIGGLMESICLYEAADYIKGIDPGFLADELTVLTNYLEKFDQQKLQLVEKALAQIDQNVLADREKFESVASAIREQLKPLAEPLKQRSVNLLGHSHLDMAWLWRVNETYQVAQRTFTSVLNLQKYYSELVFGHSTSCLYQWLEINQNEQFQAIKNAINSGVWEVLGGMWVEPDTNLLQGESLIRQLLYGQEYLIAKFGSLAKVAWLPDTFGFTWQLPQIFKLAGIEYFVTGKLHWNDTTKFPHGLFNWESPDGSQILTLISPPNVTGVMDTNPISMSQYALDWEQQTGLKDAFWLPGVGDHGGGPTRDMLEVQRRWSKSPFFPQINFTSAKSYLQQFATKNLPIWSDELYLEFHRGCYTTHADQKKYNRSLENLLYQAELWSSLVCILQLEDYYYPASLLEQAWKNVLFNQFHDILPGTSIREVFEDSNKLWEQAQDIGQKILNKALVSIAAHLAIPNGDASPANSRPILVFNSLNCIRSELINLTSSCSKVYNWQGKAVESQISAQGELLFLAQDLPPIGYSLFWVSNQEFELSNNYSKPEYVLDNGLLQVVVNSTTGDLDSIFDLINKVEILRGSGNQLQVFQDQGQYWDAWNIDPQYQQHLLEPTKLESIESLENGPIRWTIRVNRRFRNSLFTQDYCLIKGSNILKINSQVDWHQEHVLVKAAFAFNLNSEVATYEIACGAIERPQGSSTKWEVPALRWASLNDSKLNYGVSLLNDCKYGYDTQDNTMRLTLLRGSQWPDPQADKGMHHFSYAIYPYTGSWQQSQTLQYAMEFNQSCIVLEDWPNIYQDPYLEPSCSLLFWQSKNLIPLALKLAQNGKDWILRIYEAQGEQSTLVLEGAANLKIDQSCDLLEKPIDGSSLVKPYQIASYSIISQSS